MNLKYIAHKIKLDLKDLTDIDPTNFTILRANDNPFTCGDNDGTQMDEPPSKVEDFSYVLWNYKDRDVVKYLCKFEIKKFHETKPPNTEIAILLQ